MNKEKLLLILALAPFPKTSGGAVRAWQTIKYLSQRYDLHLIFLQNKSYQLQDEEEKFLTAHSVTWTSIPLRQKQNFSYLHFGQPYWFSDYYSPVLIKKMQNTIAQQAINKVQIEGTQLLYLQKFTPPPMQTSFVAYDISTVTFWRRLTETKNFLKIIVNFWRWFEIYAYEKKYLPKYKIVVAMSAHDAEILRRKFNVQQVEIIPNGLETLEILPLTVGTTLNLGYIGGFAHTPNERAVKYFIQKIAPLLEERNIDYHYYLAGENNPKQIKTWLQTAQLRQPNRIINLGKITNLKSFYQKIDVLLVTLFSGSGTRIKVLEALGYGRKIISTQIGAEGLDATALKIDLANHEQEIVAAIQNFDKSTWRPAAEQLKKLQWQNIFADTKI